MEDNTTTSTASDTPQAGDNPQLTDQGQEAVQTQEHTETNPEKSQEQGPGEQPDNSEDDDLREWAAKKNLPLDDPIKLAKMYREAERKIGSQPAGETLTDATAKANEQLGVDDVQSLRTEMQITRFFTANPDAAQYEGKMVEILDTKPYLGQDFDTLYKVAKSEVADERAMQARKQGRQEALTLTAQAERAGAPQTNATTRAQPKDLTDADVRDMSMEEYNAAVASGRIKPYG